MEEKIVQLKLSNTPDEIKEFIYDGSTVPIKLQLLQEFVNLEQVKLTNCSIASLKNFPKLANLTKLDLSSNNISTTLFFLHGCQKITHLNLSNNKIKEPGVLKPLAKLKNLQSLQLANSDVTSAPYYRQKVFKFVKNLQDLDGISKTAADQEPIPAEIEDVDMEEGGTTPTKKRKAGDTPAKKKQKTGAAQIKNPLMQLNELHPGLKYVVVSVSGPSHSPEYEVSVEVRGQKFTGSGNSKQLAKHSCAQNVLSSMVQFKDMHSVVGMQSINQDFTMDHDENNGFGFKFEVNKNGSAIKPAKGNTSLKVLMEADKKNPIALLHEIHPSLNFELGVEKPNSPSQRFSVKVIVGGKAYEGCGQSKKLAKQSCARSVLAAMYDVSYNVLPAQFSSDPATESLFKFPQAVADNISKLLMTTFDDVMVGNPDHAKWKVIAGIAMTKDEAMEDVSIISVGTGTKCINGEHISMVGATLNDCHAEIISRRCMKDFLYTNLELYLEGEGDQSIFLKREQGGFQLKPDIKFHLYISTAPCGDARIFCPHEEGIAEGLDKHPNRNSRGVLRTKIESGEGTIPIKSSQGVQTWDSILPGQERLLTMSCSDKVAQWNVVGVQGALLSHFLEPIYLDSVVLGGLFHPNHLCRALFSRFESSLPPLPELFRLNKPRMTVITSREARHLVKSPNFSVNWTSGLGRAEVVNATTGKTESGGVSRLSKRSFFQRFTNIYDRLPHMQKFQTPRPPLYANYKHAVLDYQKAKTALTQACVAAKLGTWVKKPVEQNDFELGF